MSNYIIRELPEVLHRWLKHEAINQGKTLNQLVIAILDGYKKEREGK